MERAAVQAHGRAGSGDQMDFLVKMPRGLISLKFLGSDAGGIVMTLPKIKRSGARTRFSASVVLSLECNVGFKTSVTNVLHTRD